MKNWRMLLTGLAFLVAVLPVERAEAQVAFGPQVVLWDFEDVGLGARVDVALGEAFGIEDGAFRAFTGSANVNYLFNDSDVTTLVFNLNGLVPINSGAALTPYLGAGLNHLRSSINDVTASSSGLNVVGGLMFGMGTLPAFAELQYSTTGSGFASLSVGVLFGG